MVLYELRILCDSKTKGEIEREIDKSDRDFEVNWYKKFTSESMALKETKIILDRVSTLNVPNEDITLWLFYAYENECNLEFDTLFLELISELGISFCISCWQS